MRNKYRNYHDMNKIGGKAIQLKLTHLQPALKNLTNRKPRATFSLVGTKCFWKWKTFCLQTQLHSWASEGFFPWVPPEEFSKISQMRSKVVKFVFSHLKLRKQPFLLKFSNSGGGRWSSSDDHDCIHFVRSSFVLNRCHVYCTCIELFS